MPQKKTIGIIGAGVMGKALIRALLEKKIASTKDIWASTKQEETSSRVAHEFGIEAATDFRKKIKDTDILLLCVKPSQVKAVLQDLSKAKLRKDILMISIAAGVTLQQLEAYIGQPNPVLRAMPNTPCLVGEGVIAVSAGKHAEARHLAIAREIFSAVGLYLELEERHFNAVTGLSGSGPAYFFLIMEALADGGVRVGLPRDLALQMVTQSMLGSAKMMQAMGRHPAALRDDVTTPAGCTIGALLVMEDGKIRSTLARAIEEATRIANTLGENPA